MERKSQIVYFEKFSLPGFFFFPKVLKVKKK
jgi:hypothetical protein